METDGQNVGPADQYSKMGDRSGVHFTDRSNEMPDWSSFVLVFRFVSFLAVFGS